MSEQADLDELARRYLDLWQDQITALAADEDFARDMARLMGAMGLGGPAALTAWSQELAAMGPAFPTKAKRDGAKGDGHSEQRRGETDAASGRAAAGSPAVAPAPPGGITGLDDIARRLGALEERISALEAGASRSRRKPSRKPGQRRS